MPTAISAPAPPISSSPPEKTPPSRELRQPESPPPAPTSSSLFPSTTVLQNGKSRRISISTSSQPIARASPKSFGQQSWQRKSTDISSHPPLPRDAPPSTPGIARPLPPQIPAFSPASAPCCAPSLDCCRSSASKRNRDSLPFLPKCRHLEASTASGGSFAAWLRNRCDI